MMLALCRLYTPHAVSDKCCLDTGEVLGPFGVPGLSLDSESCIYSACNMILLSQVTPIIQADGVSYMYVQYSNLYLLVVTRENVNATSMLLFLHKLKEVFVHYFNELEEESLRDNFVIAYELLDEVDHHT